MAKKTTTEKPSLSAAPKPKKTPAKRKPAAKTSLAAAPKAAKTPAPRKPPAAKAAAVISDADIALRAYFIAERRQNLGWEGGPEGDWLEARRQLEEEAANPGL